MTHHWYFAYGSNLSLQQMKDRLGSVPESKRARLDGYRFLFNKRSRDGTAKANIVPCPDSTVWGVVYCCTPAELEVMDGREGVKGGHYARKEVRVRLDSDDELTAVTYIAGAWFLVDGLAPSAEYLGTILRGAGEHHLPDSYLGAIEEEARRQGGHDARRPS